MGSEGFDEMEMLFELMDVDGSGSVSPKEFVRGLKKMKGPSTHRPIESFFLFLLGTAVDCRLFVWSPLVAFLDRLGPAKRTCHERRCGAFDRLGTKTILESPWLQPKAESFKQETWLNL